MSTQRNREEVVNTQLAILISKLGVTADAETIHVHGKHRPDVLFEMRGLRVVIEGKFEDNPAAAKVVLDDARKRVSSGIAHIACALIYPKPLRSAPTTKILGELSKSSLKYRIVAETHETDDWFEGSPSDIMSALRRAQETLTEDDIVEKTAKALSIRLEGVARLWMGQTGACDKLSSLLGIKPPKGEPKDKAAARRESAAKVSALVLANALIFQEQLAATDGRITGLRKIEKATDLVDAISDHWKWIWENINYVPIFQLGERVLAELPSSINTTSAVRSLLVEAKAICAQQAALRHDLMGRIYHWLLHNAKYLGTYYTSVSSATLLLKLAMSAEWEQDFGNPVDLASFKVGDLACGTGTLLMAAAQAVSDVYIKVRAEDGRSLGDKDLSTLHRAIMENMLHGYDVLPSAVHLTASTLAMLAPEVAFVKMNLFVMPMGIDHGQVRLGSLDFLDDNEIKTQMALDYSHAETVQTGAAFSKATKAKIPPLHLCVMNPPFVRSVGGNLLFGSLPDDRGLMQKELKARIKKIGASATAGLGSVFVALADRRLAKGGRLAFVLPAALASGEAWAQTRKLIADRYHLETVVASHDATRPNFSENTELSEILFIARKRGMKPTGPTRFVNLWRNPRSIHEALDLATRISQHVSPVDITGVGFTSIQSPNGKLGEIMMTSAPMGEENWTGALFAQTELSRACWSLQKGAFRIPGDPRKYSIPVCRLDQIGAIGPDRKRVHEGFKVSTEDWSPYPGFWGHESAKVKTIAQKPNSKLVVWTDSPRGPNYGPHLFERSGKILLAERLRSNTHRVIGVGFETNVLGNTWWALRTSDLSIEQEKSLLVWFNSSMSILLFFGRRVITQGAWMQMKQPAWESMPTIDVRALNSSQLKKLSDAYDDLSTKELKAISSLESDPVRIQIDEAIEDALSLTSLSPIRELLGREPGLNAWDIRKPREIASLDKLADHKDDLEVS